MKNLHYIQHVPFETPGCILDWADQNRISVSSTHTYKGEEFPAPDDPDYLVVMGGPMGVKDTAAFPWLVAEKKFISQAIQHKKKIIGICLGAQLLADILDAHVYANNEKEIGWFPISLTQKALAHDLFAGFANELDVFHWHGETFTLPENSLLLASSQACQNQAFLYREHVLGFQFHLEVKKENVNSLLTHCANDLSPSLFTQDADTIQKSISKTKPINDNLFSLLDKFFI